MIFYYSATGNTRFAARLMADGLGEECLNLLEVNPEEIVVKDGETVGLMFPIYCWGVPPVVNRFAETLFRRLHEDVYIWFLATCGDETGIALRQLNRKLQEISGRKADAVFSLTMPNTYVLLPGFDVDSPAVEKAKLEKAPKRLSEISGIIKKRQRGVYDVHEGSVPALRTRLLYPLFEKWGVFPSRWNASASCIGCGKCAEVCPARNISMENRRPQWGGNCYSCCACFHICPVKAVNYGKITLNKSQYQPPFDKKG